MSFTVKPGATLRRRLSPTGARLVPVARAVLLLVARLVATRFGAGLRVVLFPSFFERPRAALFFFAMIQPSRTAFSGDMKVPAV
jgi:hypothetical protein